MTSPIEIAVSLVFALGMVLFAAPGDGVPERARHSDMLCPAFYAAAEGSSFRNEVEAFVERCREVPFGHPLGGPPGRRPPFRVPAFGRFGAGKGPGGDKGQHPAVDFHVGNRGTKVTVYAAHDGQVATLRDAPKYRHCIAVTKDIVAANGKRLGKLVTIYGHIDLDLDEADGLRMDGKTVRRGEPISRHLYSGTRGGPHLHFEIRYYRAGDRGDETFYGSRLPHGHGAGLTEPSAGPWRYGYWNPRVGYGFADPRNHGVACY